MRPRLEPVKSSLEKVMEGFSDARIISVIGGGGKTTFVHWLTKERAKTGRTLLTTTTAMFEPTFLPIDYQTVKSNDNPSALFSHYIRQDKLKGITPEEVDRLKDSHQFDSIIVEADGSKGRPFKSYDSYEPPIPQTSDLVILMVGLDGFNQPISQVVHRPEILAEALSLELSQPMTPEICLRHFKHPKGALKNVPDTEVIVVLNRIDQLADHQVIEQLVPGLFEDQRVKAILLTNLLKPKLEAVYYPTAPEDEMEYLTIASFHEAMTKGASPKRLIQGFVDRIKRSDKQGPAIKAVIQINPNWEEELTDITEQLDPQAPLYGVPVLVKDNIDVKGMATTAGSLSLEHNIAKEDAEIIRRIRQAGGLILAKTNLHEFAIWGETISSMLGQTKNPFDLTRTPGGSSGGTGAGLAMDYGIIGLGTDTINSIRSPASANHLVGLRPTTGKLPSQGIIPYSLTQDTAGPMGRNLADVNLLYRVLAEDWREVKLVERPRVGVLRSFFGTDPDVNQVMDQVLARLSYDVELIELEETFDNQYLIDQVSVHLYDLKDHLNVYLSQLTDSPIRSLADILTSGKYHPGIEENLKRAAKLSTSDPAYQVRLKEAGQWKQKLRELYDKYDLTALVYPHQQQLVCRIGQSQLGRNGVLASITGFCSLALPGGFSQPSGEAPVGVPIGYELLGRAGKDLELLALGKLVFDETNFIGPQLKKE